MPRRSYFCASSADLDNVPMNGIGLVPNNAGQMIPYEWNGTAWVQIYDLAEEVNRLELEKQNKIAEIDKLRKSLETREE